MLQVAGEEACESGYQTNNPALIGMLALAYGDINPNGTLN